MFKPKVISKFTSTPQFLRDAKYLEYTVGNPVLDGSKFSETTVVKAGTAISKNEETGLYELVTEGTSDIVAGVLTATDVEVEPNENVNVGALRKASVRPELLTGVTDAFKEATKGRIVYDI